MPPRAVFNHKKINLYYRFGPFDNLVSLTVPTAEERRGDFSKTQENGRPVTIKDPRTGLPFAGNVVPTDRLNKYGQELLNFYPLPNRLGVDNTYNYQYQFEPTDRINDRTFRVDYNISSKWKFYARLIENSRDRFQLVRSFPARRIPTTALRNPGRMEFRADC